MSLLWAVPPVAVLIATLVVMWQLHAISEATGDLASQLRRLEEVRVAVADVRAASAEARATAKTLRAR